VAASVVPRRVVKSAARVGGRSAMMCGGDGVNVVQKKWVQKWLRGGDGVNVVQKKWLQVGCGWWCVCVHKKIFFGLA